MINYEKILSTTEPNNYIGVLKVRRNDKATQKLVATIETNGMVQDLTGLTAVFNTRTKTDHVVMEKAVITNGKNGTVEYVFSDASTQQLLNNEAYFTFLKDDIEQFSTKDFTYIVTNSVTSDGVKGCDYIWQFEDLLDYVTDLANQSQVQLNKLTSDVEVIQKQIDDMLALIKSQGVLTADEVRRMMVDFMAGEDIEITIKSDFIGKIANSNAENANNLQLLHSATLATPDTTGGSAAQEYIDKIKKLDNDTFTVVTPDASADLISQCVFTFNVVSILEKTFADFFKTAPALADKINVIKNKITTFIVNVYGKGSGLSGNKVTLQNWGQGNNWVGNATNTTTNISKLSLSSQMKFFIANDGCIHSIAYADKASATVASSVSVDYANIEFKVKLNINEFVPSRKEFDNHVNDTIKHITADERTKWNAKQDVSKLSKNEKLWTGGLIMIDSHSIKPSKTLSQCENGWILKWNKYTRDVGTEPYYSCLTYLPKNINTAGTIAFPVAIMQKYDVPVITKNIAYSNSELLGHNANNLAPNNVAVLTEVWSY